MSQYALSLNLPALYTADNFIVSACNRAAWKWLESWPEWPGHALLLCGPEGSGKTHLGHLWAQRSGAKIIPGHSLDTTPPTTGHCMVEDLETVHDERALLHLYNFSRENKFTLLLTTARPVQALPFSLPDLTSRLLATPVAEIAQPDDAVLAGAMRKQFTDRQMAVEEEVIAYILPRIERSLSSVKIFVETVDSTALAERKNITIPFVKKLLQTLHEQPML